MYKKMGCMMLVWLLLLSGCANSTAGYKDGDVAAIVRGEEITIGDLRFLYPDEAVTEMIDSAVKAKLAEQEVKKMNIDISDKVKEVEESYSRYPKNEVYSEGTQSVRAFADSQAKKMGMTPEEYYRKYIETSAEMVAYVDVYTSNILGELEDDEFGIEEYTHHANELLEMLVDQNKESIKIFGKKKTAQ